jgi:Flp pilus assembly protein TadB
VGYALKLAAAAIAFLIAGVAAIVIFSGVWSRIGFGAAIVIVCGGLLLLAWRADKKARESRAGLERI